MPQVGGGAALEEDIDDQDLLARPSEVEHEEPGLEPDLDEPPEPEAEPTPEPEVSMEDRARAMGWHPLSEYRGDPRRWVPAADFVKKAETETPIMRDQNRRMQEKITRMEGQITSLQNTAQEQLAALREMREIARTNDQRGYDRALTELKTKQREAVEAGDTAAFDQIDEQIGELEKNRPTTTTTTTATPAPVMDPTIAAFTQRDDVAPWWNKDESLTRAMVASHDIVKMQSPAMPLAQQLERALTRVKADFPAYFGAEEEPDPMREPTPTPRPTVRASAVARPTPAGAGGARPRSRWDSITDPGERAEARAQYGRQVKVDPNLGEDEFLDIYLDPHADVLAVQAKRRKA